MRRFIRGKRVLTDRRGVTIVVAILILAIVVIIIFAIGALAVREIRNSRLQTHTEPAISIAEAGAERLLFYRSRNLSEFNSPCPIAFEAGTATGFFVDPPTSFEACTNYYDPVAFNTTAAEVKVVVLNNPLDLDDNGAGYSEVEIYDLSNVASPLFRVHAYDLNDPSACPIDSLSLSATGSHTISGLDPDASYALFIYPCGNPGTPPTCSGGGSSAPSCSSGNVSGVISGTANTDDGTFTGVPLDDVVIESTGERQGLLRKLQVILDRPGD